MEPLDWYCLFGEKNPKDPNWWSGIGEEACNSLRLHWLAEWRTNPSPHRLIWGNDYWLSGFPRITPRISQPVRYLRTSTGSIDFCFFWWWNGGRFLDCEQFFFRKDVSTHHTKSQVLVNTARGQFENSFGITANCQHGSHHWASGNTWPLIHHDSWPWGGKVGYLKPPYREEMWSRKQRTHSFMWSL